jgi:hypothetical protein
MRIIGTHVYDERMRPMCRMMENLEHQEENGAVIVSLTFLRQLLWIEVKNYLNCHCDIIHATFS